MAKETTAKSSDTSKKTSDTKSDKSSSPDSGGSDKAGSGATAKGGASSRPISYFSSVATDEYREGWANIFGKPGGAKKRAGSSNSAKSAAKDLPKSIRLSEDDLDEELQSLLRETLKKRARRDKLGIGRQLNKADLSWSIDCRIKY